MSAIGIHFIILINFINSTYIAATLNLALLFVRRFDNRVGLMYVKLPPTPAPIVKSPQPYASSASFFFHLFCSVLRNLGIPECKTS